MAEQFIPIRSVKGYFKEFCVEALVKKKGDRNLIKNQLIAAFKDELFNQFSMKLGDPQILAKDDSLVDPETKKTVDNILSNTVRKWKRLCIECQKYRETCNWIFPSELMTNLEDTVKALTEGENTTNEEVVALEDDSVDKTKDAEK